MNASLGMTGSNANSRSVETP
jgi:serine/threonine protein phosphatase PrpC